MTRDEFTATFMQRVDYRRSITGEPLQPHPGRCNKRLRIAAGVRACSVCGDLVGAR